MKILIAGLPGSGKTTQALKLARELDICLIRTGDILRDMSDEVSELGKEIQEALEKGQLVSDELVAKVVRERVADSECKRGFVMDGYPRAVHQIKYFDPSFDKVFFLRISEDEVFRRLSKRGRFDDTEEVITRRLSAQEENMFEVLGYYKVITEVHEINGEKTVDQIHAEIRSFIP